VSRLSTHAPAEEAALRGAPWLGWLLLVVVIVVAVRLALPSRPSDPVWQIAGADARRGRELIRDVGCAGCHTVPGVREARGNVGPPLTRFA